MCRPTPLAESEDQVLSASDVADLFGVDPKTVTRWAKAGQLPSFKTPGGHRRYRKSDCTKFINSQEAK